MVIVGRDMKLRENVIKYKWNTKNLTEEMTTSHNFP